MQAVGGTGAPETPGAGTAQAVLRDHREVQPFRVRREVADDHIGARHWRQQGLHPTVGSRAEEGDTVGRQGENGSRATVQDADALQLERVGAFRRGGPELHPEPSVRRGPQRLLRHRGHARARPQGEVHQEVRAAVQFLRRHHHRRFGSRARVLQEGNCCARWCGNPLCVTFVENRRYSRNDQRVLDHGREIQRRAVQGD